MDNFKFLTGINGIYNYLTDNDKNIINRENILKYNNIRELIINNTSEYEDINIFDKINVYVNDYQYLIKLVYIREDYEKPKYTYINEDKLILTNISIGEKILSDIKDCEFSYLLNLFSESQSIFKNIVFNKYLDYLKDCLNYIYIY